MHYHVIIHGIETVTQLEGYWTNAHYRELLEAFEFAGAAEVSDAELWEYLTLVIRELKPDEAAKIVLTHQLGEELSEGQIDQISHEMLIDKVSEEYPDIAYHKRLYAVNQLLYRAYNGKFPKIEASVIDCTLEPVKGKPEHPVDAEIAIKSIGQGLNDHSVISRLLGEQLRGEVAFPMAEHIVWNLESLGDNRFKVTTSDYWVSEEDVERSEYDALVVEFEE